MADPTLTCREWINAALNHAGYLRNGLALCCASVQDPDQRRELEGLIECLLFALEAEEKSHG